MRRHFPLCAAALVPLCGAAVICALALAPRTAGQSATNFNGNMGGHAVPQTPTSNSNSNSNSNPVTMTREPVRPRPTPRPVPRPPVVRWSAPASASAFFPTLPAKLRAGAGARAAVVEELDAPDYENVEVLGAEGDFVRVRVERSAEGAKRKGRFVEGWLAWGEVMPQTTALVLDAKTGRVLARHALGSGIDTVTFSPDGERALFHGQWASAVYEADADDLAPARKLAFEGEGTFTGAAYVGTGHDLLVPYWSNASQSENAAPTVYVVRSDAGGNVTAAPFGFAPSGVEPSRLAFAPDGRTGFAFYGYSYGDESELAEDDERASAVTVEVFDPLTMQKVRHFKAPYPGLSFDPGMTAMNADGSQLYLLDQPGQRLVVVETQTGGVVREFSLAGERQQLLSFAQNTLDAAGPRLRFWEVAEEHVGESRSLRVAGGQIVEDDAGGFLVVEAGGARRAVDETGALLLTLDGEGRVLKRQDIPRREGDYQMPAGLFATPDGSRLVLILSVPEDGC